MSNVLRPYTDFETTSLAREMGASVSASKDTLRLRNFVGVIARYGSTLDYAEHWIDRGKRAHLAGKMGAYAIVDSSGDVRGGASIMPELPLTELRLPLPSRYNIGPLRKNYPYAKPNIAAWTVNEELLQSAYTQVVALAKQREGADPHELIWTIEPTRSFDYVHDAIAKSGLVKWDDGRYDDFEDTHAKPLQNSLYLSTIFSPLIGDAFGEFDS